jgi:DNA modification methylase
MTQPYYEGAGLVLHHGDCRDVLASLPECSVDAIVTDPPYGIGFMAKGWDTFNPEYIAARKPRGLIPGRTDVRDGAAWAAGAYDRSLEGNRGFQLWCETWAVEALRVLKPGGHMLVCGSPRTYHRMACGIEDAGFEIRDCLQWLFGSGFPKSLNLHGEWEGWGTALKPAYEPIVMARKPLVGTVAGNVAAYGVGGLNIDGCRIEHASEADRKKAIPGGRITSKSRHVGAEPDAGNNEDRIEFEPSAFKRYNAEGSTDLAALPGVRGGDPLGRWPANVLLDAEAAAALDAQAPATGAYAPVRGTEPTKAVFSGLVYGSQKNRQEAPYYGDIGGASRFFYTAKTSRAEREFGLEDLHPTRRSDGREKDIENPRLRTNTRRNDHPTVKPVDLMRWLCRLVTPPGGTICDPFLGSGSTGMAALDEGFRFIGIDLEAHYLDIARRRITRRHVLEPLPQRENGQGALPMAVLSDLASPVEKR